MSRFTHLLAATLATLATCAATSALAQIDLKGKLKAGEYQYTMSVEMGEMPGVPAGMKMPGTTFKQCISQKDIDEGSQRALGQKGPGGGEMPKDCQSKDLKASGNNLSYKVVCTGEMKLEMDVNMTFMADGFKGTSKMKGVQNGRPMNMTSNMDVRYLGACKS